MARHWKNSDDITYFTEKSIQNRLEKLKMELIPGYAERKKKNYNNNGKSYQKRGNQNLKKK